MKKISARIDPTRFDDLRDYLACRGIDAVTVRNCHIVDSKTKRRVVYRGLAYVIDQISPLVEIAIVVSDEQVATMVAAIERHGGEGDILISRIDQVVRISKRGVLPQIEQHRLAA